MQNLEKAIELAMTEFKKRFGEDAVLEDSCSFAVVFNDGVLIMSNENKQAHFNVIVGTPAIVDFSLNLAEED